MFFLIFAAIAAGLSAIKKSQKETAQKSYEANVASANADAKRQEAIVTRQKTEIEARAKAKEGERIKREYRSQAGTNISLLAKGNLDISSGSALDLLEGNANLFADDMGEIAYEKSQIEWSGNREADLQDWEADVFDSRASYLEKTKGGLGTSLLSGITTGVGTYASLR